MLHKKPRHNMLGVLALVSLLCGVIPCIGPEAGALPRSTGLTSQTAPVPVSIFVLPSTGVKNMDTNWFTLDVEKLFNMKITWVQTTAVDAVAKESLLFASGDYPDAFFAQSLSTTNLLKYAQQGVVINLAPYIRKYGAKHVEGPPKHTRRQGRGRSCGWFDLRRSVLQLLPAVLLPG